MIIISGNKTPLPGRCQTLVTMFIVIVFDIRPGYLFTISFLGVIFGETYPLDKL